MFMFDLDTMKAKHEIRVGGKPDAILYGPAPHKLFTFNGKNHDVTVIDARQLAVVAAIPASGRPEAAVRDNAGNIYINIEDNPGIDVIDVASNSLAARWKLNGREEPSGLAMNLKNQRLFSTYQNESQSSRPAKYVEFFTRENV